MRSLLVPKALERTGTGSALLRRRLARSSAIAYSAEPDLLIAHLKQDQAIVEADTLLLRVPNQPGVASNTHVLEVIFSHVAPALVWR